MGYRLGGRSSNSGRGNNGTFLVTASIPALGPTQHPIQWVVGGSYSGGKATGVWSWSRTSTYFRGYERMELYLHSPIRLHGM